MTIEQLAAVMCADPRINGTDEVRIVFHGYNQRSFNLPVVGARKGANGTDFIIICEEDRDTGSKSV